MRIIQRTIPDEFIKFDDSVTSANRFLNVRDLQRARLNHNILLARGIRQPTVWTMDAQGGSNAGYVEFVDPDLPGLDDERSVRPILRQRVLLTQRTRSCTLVLRVEMSRASLDGKVYFVLSQPHNPRPLSAGDSETVNGTSTTWTNNLSASVPPNLRANKHGRIEVEAAIYYTANQYSAVQFSGVAITAASSTTIACATASIGTTNVGDIIYTSTAAVQPRIVTDRSDSGGTTTFTVSKPWFGDIPSTADTLTVRFAAALRVLAFSLVEDSVSDFEATAGAL